MSECERERLTYRDASHLIISSLFSNGSIERNSEGAFTDFNFTILIQRGNCNISFGTDCTILWLYVKNNKHYTNLANIFKELLKVFRSALKTHETSRAELLGEVTIESI